MDGLRKVYFIDGDYIGEKRFQGEPLVGDCFLMNVDIEDIEPGTYLVYVHSRRWTDAGDLELIVAFHDPISRG